MNVSEGPMSETLRRDSLLEQLDADIASYASQGFWNNVLDLSLTITTVLASLLAAGLVAAGPANVGRWLVVCVAAIPAAAASIQKTVGVRERSNWYFLYAAEVRSLATRLRYSSAANVDDVAEKRARLEVSMEADWSRIGHSMTIHRST